MEYNIKLTDSFLEEISEILDYISNNLKSPDISKKILSKIINNILLLEKMPRMFGKINKFSKAKKQYRRIVIKRYVILYTISEENRTVYISHIYNGKRNYIYNDLL